MLLIQEFKAARLKARVLNLRDANWPSSYLDMHTRTGKEEGVVTDECIVKAINEINK